ncbi:MAG: hypothetical protein HOW73_07685 [Polyangiaceae bacterium]|nr:hypothetical protein [Polyangiaceae bacterium]
MSDGGARSARTNHLDIELHDALAILCRARVRIEVGLLRPRSVEEYRASLRESLLDMNELSRLLVSSLEDLNQLQPFDDDCEGQSPRKGEGTSFE